MFLNELTISAVHRGLQKKEFSVQELVKSCLAEIKKENKRLNVFVSVFEKLALARAKEADKKIASRSAVGPLFGIPLAIKDNILIRDLPCAAGSKILKNYQATYDAAVIEKLKTAGAIFLGKTNLDEFAMGGSTEFSVFGPTKNPLNPAYVAGGSSGGSAAAVAADMCLGALGSDTGGSIRQPASFCGLVGLKPSYGCVSRYGLIAMASSLDQIGVLTKNVEDAAILFQAIRGKDNRDATSLEVEGGNLAEIKLKNVKIGLPKEYFVAGLDPKIKKTIEQLIKKLEEEGAKVKKTSLPYTKYALACYYIIMPAEVSTNLARYDGIKYGFSESKARNLLDVYLRSRSRGFGGEVKRRIILGTYLLSAGYYDAYYLQAQKVRALIRKDFTDVFAKEKFDCLLTPTSPVLPWKLGEKINDPLSMYLADVYTVSANLAGLPALSLPVGEIGDFSVGGQIIGDYFQENKILQIGKMIEKLF